MMVQSNVDLGTQRHSGHGVVHENTSIKAGVLCYFWIYIRINVSHRLYAMGKKELYGILSYLKVPYHQAPMVIIGAFLVGFLILCIPNVFAD